MLAKKQKAKYREALMIDNISEVLDGVKTVGIGGHVRPDGDCIGSCLALYLYLRRNYPEIETDIYLEEPRQVFYFLGGFDDIRTEPGEDKQYDLFITCDVSARARIGVAGDHFDRAAKTVCIDHHVSNPGFADVNHIRGGISSASEVLYGVLDKDKIDCGIAEALYTGIAHDTGVFHYSSTTPETMRIAADLMAFGFDFGRILDDTFFKKTYLENQVIGRVLAESIMLGDGKCIVGSLRKKDMDFYQVKPVDLDGVIAQLNLTSGIEVAIFLYEFELLHYKVSLRSSGNVDVSKIAMFFGGGGHERAAGFEMNGTFYDIVNNITEQIEKQCPL